MRPRNFGSIPSWKKKLFSDPKLPENLWPPPILLIKGYFLGGAKRPGREADHIPLSSAEVKNEWSYASTASLCLRGVQKDNFIFFLLCGTWEFNIYCTGFWEKCENGHADVSEKIYAAISFSVTYNKSIKAFPKRRSVLPLRNVQDSGKSVKMVTPTFRGKFMQQSCFSVTYN